MGSRVVVLGAGVGGLAAAIGLGRRGHQVTVVERDLGPTTDDGDEAFLTWERRGVPQFRQPHAFSARSRNLLLAHAPDVIERLKADGIEETNIFKLLAPADEWRPEDDAFTGLMTRRPAFELALRRAVEVEPGVELLCPAAAAGLRYLGAVEQPRRVSGVRLADGRELDADLVLDCGGHRSPVPRWLAEEGINVPQDVQDCEVVYYTRYYRQKPESTLLPVTLFGVRGELERLFFIGFIGDHGTCGFLLSASPDDAELRVLRQNWAWEAIARSIPSVAPWIDPANATPLHDVQVMAGHQNVRRRYVVDGEPLVLGLLPVGDSLCTTNPAYGWGASMALTYAFAAVDAVVSHGADARAVVLAYDAAVAPEADAVYRESAAMDRARIYRAKAQDIPEHDRPEIERQELIARGVSAGALRDVVLGRALLRRINLIDAPDGILDDPVVLARAREVREILAAKPPRALGPTRDELLAILARSAPDPVPV